MRLEGSTRVRFGDGARLGQGALQLEGALVAGAVTGRPGFNDPVRDGARRVLPQVGGQLSGVLARWVVLSAESHWTRLSCEWVLGASVRFADAEHRVRDAADAQLMVHAIPPEHAASITITSPPAVAESQLPLRVLEVALKAG